MDRNKAGQRDIQSDDRLFALIQQSDEEAFAEVYERYNRLLYTLAFRFLKSGHEAENAVQSVFARLWEYRTDIAVSISLRNYLYTMVKNYVLNYIRNRNAATVKNYEIAQRDGLYDDGLLAALERKEVYEQLQQAIDRLPEQKRQIVRMKREGLSNQEIAEQLGLSVNTVKSHYQQCLKLLKESLSSLIRELPLIVAVVLLLQELK